MDQSLAFMPSGQCYRMTWTQQINPSWFFSLPHQQTAEFTVKFLMNIPLSKLRGLPSHAPQDYSAIHHLTDWLIHHSSLSSAPLPTLWMLANLVLPSNKFLMWLCRVMMLTLAIFTSYGLLIPMHSLAPPSPSRKGTGSPLPTWMAWDCLTLLFCFWLYHTSQCSLGYDYEKITLARKSNATNPDCFCS